MKYFSAEKLYSDDLRTNTEMQNIQKINRVIQKMIYIIYLDKTKINANKFLNDGGAVFIT